MVQERRSARSRLGELAIAAAVIVLLVAAREFLPTDGWGLALRRVLGVLSGVCFMLWLVAQIVSAAREFRRGWRDET